MDSVKKRITALKNDLDDKDSRIDDLTDLLKQQQAEKQEVSRFVHDFNSISPAFFFRLY